MSRRTRPARSFSWSACAADDGSKLATIELSTPFEAHGPEFRGMIVQLAASVSSEPPAVSGEDGGNIEQVLG
jgi:hypothetical protein